MVRKMKKMRIKVSAPKYLMPATAIALVLLIRGTLKVQEIVSLYSYVNKNDLEESIEHVYIVENVTIKFVINGNKIFIISANFEKPNHYEKFFKLSLHFMEKLIERTFDLNILVTIYQYVMKTEIIDGQEIEMNIMHSTACIVKYDKTVKLITGWAGTREAA